MSSAACFGWRPIDPITQREINKNDAINHNVEFFMELAEKLPNCIREAGFNVIGDPCYYGVSILISSKKYPNLLARVDMTDQVNCPGMITFIYYVTERISASFVLSVLEFLDLVNYYDKRFKDRLCTPDKFEALVQSTINDLGIKFEPYKFKYLSDTYEHDFDITELNFEIQPVIKWAHLEEFELKIETLKLSREQYYCLKLFTGN